MLNLFDEISDLDNKRIENFISLFGVESGYVGNETYLSYWANCKKKLFHLLDGKLIYKFPISVKKPDYQLEDNIRNFIYSSPFIIAFNKDLDNLFYEKDVISREEFTSIINIFDAKAFKDNKIRYDFKIRLDNKNLLQLKKGMKTMKALQKVINYFDFKCKDLFEDFRISHSLILNDVNLTGNLCLSIHPLDFMTMSDNNSNWSSCMSWVEEGCFHEGTVEMMNSNNVICCYLESTKEQFDFSKKNKHLSETNENKGKTEWSWNNKKWRELFYVTKDIILGGKAYPYANDELTTIVLNKLRELAKKNLHWTYTFGPESYMDMIHIGSDYRMNKNRTWVANHTSFKHNILFDTKGMYNDMFNDRDYNYLCIRNKVDKEKIISCSGKAPCLCCMKSVVDYDEDYDEYYENSYNSRYTNSENLLCSDCLEKRKCSYCGIQHPYTKLYEIDGRNYCSHCYNSYMRICPHCGKIVFVHNFREDGVLIRLNDSTPSAIDWFKVCEKKDENDEIISYYIDGHEDDFAFGYLCTDCKNELIAEGKITAYIPTMTSEEEEEFDKILHNSNAPIYAFSKYKTRWVTTEKYNAEDVDKYFLENLIKPTAEKVF